MAQVFNIFICGRLLAQYHQQNGMSDPETVLSGCDEHFGPAKKLYELSDYRDQHKMI